MNYGASWDNEYASVHMMEPDYQPLVAYPIAHTPGTGGKRTLDVVIADVRTRSDLEPLRGKAARPGGHVHPAPRHQPRAVRARHPPPHRRGDACAGGTRTTPHHPGSPHREPRRPPSPHPTRPPSQRSRALAFYVEEGVAVVLESNSGWPGAVRGFARPGAKIDMWDRDATLTSVPIIAVTPEHYNRMYRILERGIPVTIEAEVRNVHGAGASEARNVIGEIPGTDLAHEVVMLGAHFDTWHASPNASDNTSGGGGHARSHAHPQGGRRAAAPHDPHRALVRRGAGDLRVVGVRRRALRHSGQPRRHQTRLRRLLRLLQPGLRPRPVPRNLAPGQRERARPLRGLDGAAAATLA